MTVKPEVISQVITEKREKTVFGLLRHGETLWNSEKRIQGSSDSPLTDQGKTIVDQWGTMLKQWDWNRIEASNQGRVRETVGIINRHLNIPADFHPELQEQNWGEWEGMTLTQIKSQHRDELDRRVAKGWKFAAPGGETRSAVVKRVLNKLNQLQCLYSNEMILIVCHQGVIKALLYHLLDRKFLPGEDPLLQHNSLHLISVSNKEWTAEQLNINRNFKK